MFCIFATCLLLVFTTMKIHYVEWKRLVQVDNLGTGMVQYKDRPRIDVGMWLLELVCAVALGLNFGQYLDGTLGLTSNQWRLMVTGMACWMPIGRLFLALEYIITERGVWMLFMTFRTFVPFDELEEAKLYTSRVCSRRERRSLWKFFCSPTGIVRRTFVRLSPAQHAKFMGKRKKDLLLSPNDPLQFTQHLPKNLLKDQITTRWEDEMRKCLTILLLTTIVILASGCCGGVGQPVAIGISEIGTCKSYNEEDGTPQDITSTFSPDDERVVLYFYLETNIDVVLTYRWYYEGSLVYTHQASKNEPGYNFGWLNAKEGKQLPLGTYQIQVALGEMVIRSTEFRVEE